MKTIAKEIIFIYNAGSDLFRSLCQLTYGNLAIKEQWATFWIPTLPYKRTFLHKDETIEIEPVFLSELPVILIKAKERGVEILMDPKDLNGSTTPDKLIDTLRERLEAHGNR